MTVAEDGGGRIGLRAHAMKTGIGSAGERSENVLLLCRIVVSVTKKVKTPITCLVHR